jgi:hypothetical protein
MEAAYAAQDKSIHLMPKKKRHSPDSIGNKSKGIRKNKS